MLNNDENCYKNEFFVHQCAGLERQESEKTNYKQNDNVVFAHCGHIKTSI